MLVSETYEPKVNFPTEKLEAAARELEASFLSEMLKNIGVDGSDGDFGGGLGEEQFSSLLRAEYARAIANDGGLGLAQSFVTALAQQGRESAG